MINTRLFPGIYRLYWAAKKQFQLTKWETIHDSPVTLIISNKGELYPMAFKSVDDTVVRAKIAWCLEFISPLKPEELTEDFVLII